MELVLNCKLNTNCMHRDVKRDSKNGTDEGLTKSEEETMSTEHSQDNPLIIFLL